MPNLSLASTEFRPLPETVHLIGRQTVQLSHRQMIEILHKHGLTPAPVPIDIDRTTSYAIASGQDFISDQTFFGLLGVERVRAIDHSDFEGADIILDLNNPIPAEFAGTAQFVYGGSVLDNVFDPAAYIRNIACLMASGARLIDQNVASFHFHPYLIPSPAWYFDYFVLNGFDDCKVYFVQAGAITYLYGLELDADDSLIGDFGSARLQLPFGVASSLPRRASNRRGIGRHRKTNIATRPSGNYSAQIWHACAAPPAATSYSAAPRPWI